MTALSAALAWGFALLFVAYLLHLRRLDVEVALRREMREVVQAGRVEHDALSARVAELEKKLKVAGLERAIR